MRRILAHGALLVAAPILSFGQAQDSIATVDGQPVYERELMSIVGTNLLDLRNQEYKLKSDALNTVIRKKVLESEAKKKGLTTDELLKREVDSKVPEPTEAEAKGYYLAMKSQTSLPFDTVKEQIVNLLRNLEIQQAREQYGDSVRAKADVSVRLRPPTVNVSYDPARVEGSNDAPVTIVEFADFQCPFCKKSEDTLKALLIKYSGKVKLAFLDFPLEQMHGDAEKAAEAARCAGEQGKFWEYHDDLFANQSKLDGASLIGRARNFHLDENTFRSCLASGKFRQDIEANREEGTKAGVTGTPAYFINGVFLDGAQPQAEFEKIIDNELAMRVR